MLFFLCNPHLITNVGLLERGKQTEQQLEATVQILPRSPETAVIWAALPATPHSTGTIHNKQKKPPFGLMNGSAPRTRRPSL